MNKVVAYKLAFKTIPSFANVNKRLKRKVEALFCFVRVESNRKIFKRLQKEYENRQLIKLISS